MFRSVLPKGAPKTSTASARRSPESLRRSPESVRRSTTPARCVLAPARRAPAVVPVAPLLFTEGPGVVGGTRVAAAFNHSSALIIGKDERRCTAFCAISFRPILGEQDTGFCDHARHIPPITPAPFPLQSARRLRSVRRSVSATVRRLARHRHERTACQFPDAASRHWHRARAVR